MSKQDPRPRWQRPFEGMPQLREPNEETEDYPGLVVHDGRVTGSITVGRSRLPLWCLISDLVRAGFPRIKEDRDELYGLTADKLSEFLYWLMEQRGDFGRLLCVLADVERQARELEEKEKYETVVWWHHPEMSARVCEALERCLDALRVKSDK